MDQQDLDRITQYVNENIGTFHRQRLDKIRKLKLNDVLRRKNPYLFRAKNMNSPEALVTSILDAYLSSSEEGKFGTFLEDLAIFVGETACGCQKSSASGIDLEFTRENVRYIVAVKSGPNWGNSSQYKALRGAFRDAVRVLSQSRHISQVQPILGICYGRAATQNNGTYIKICGQAFWEFISNDAELYVKLIKPISYEAEKHNKSFFEEKAQAYNRLIQDFKDKFCDTNEQINWEALVRDNSRNIEPSGIPNPAKQTPATRKKTSSA